MNINGQRLAAVRDNDVKSGRLKVKSHSHGAWNNRRPACRRSLPVYRTSRPSFHGLLRYGTGPVSASTVKTKAKSSRARHWRSAVPRNDGTALDPKLRIFILVIKAVPFLWKGAAQTADYFIV